MIKVAPYWNVNNGFDETQGFKDFIKVAPYWNVNKVKKKTKERKIVD